MKIIVKLHSLVDVITNSSTELFIIDKNKGLDFVRQIVEETYNKYPSEYAHHKPSVVLENPEWYEGSINIETKEAIEFLENRGYKIKAPEVEQEPEAIIISWDRGYMSPSFVKEISTIFNTDVITN